MPSRFPNLQLTLELPELHVLLGRGAGQKATGLSGGGGVGHLHGNHTAEGAGAGIVLATNQAHVLLASNCASALLVGGDRGNQGEVTLLAVLWKKG